MKLLLLTEKQLTLLKNLIATTVNPITALTLGPLWSVLDGPDADQGAVMRHLGERTNPEIEAYIAAAPDRSDLGLCDGDLEYDDRPLVSESDEGAFVNCWLWVSRQDAGLNG